MDHSRLSMSLGEAIFTQRSIRRYRPDSIPLADVRLILEAAVKAPNGGNQQLARFLVVNDREAIRAFGPLYREAWWAKRRDEGFEQFDDLPSRFHAAAGLADAMTEVPCIVFALAVHNGPPDSVIPAVQNMMLAGARSVSVRCRRRFTHPSWIASTGCSTYRTTSVSISASRSAIRRASSVRMCASRLLRRASSTIGVLPFPGLDRARELAA